MNKLNLNKLIRLIFFLLGVVILLVLITRVGIKDIISALLKAKINFLIYGFLVYVLLILLRSLKWFLLMRIIENKIQFKEFLPIYGVNCLVGNITPFKSGETITPFLFRRYLKIPAGQGFSIVILDRFLELLIFVMIFIFIVAYAIANQLITGLPLDIFKFIFIVLLLIISILLTVIFSPRITFGILNKLGFLKKYSLTKKFIDFIERELKIFYDGLSLFKNKNVYNFLIPMTLTSWLLEFLSFYLILKSILPVSFLQTVAAQTISIAAALVTFIPAGIGIGDLGTVFILYLFGYPTVLATAGMVLDRLFLTSTQLIFGMISSLFLKEKVE